MHKDLVRQSSLALPLAVDQLVEGDLVDLALNDSSGFLIVFVLLIYKNL